jgi:predicted DNA binding CopG/RHH family protein
LNACWKEKVKNLHLIVQSCEQAISNKDKLFTRLSNIDLAEKTNDFQDHDLIANSFPLTRKEFDKQVPMFKALSLENFYSILQFDQAHIDDWLVKYAVQNEEIHQALSNLSIDFRELKSDIFNIKIQNEINVTPMRSYIEEWLERQLKQTADERQQVVASILAVVEDILETAVIGDINETTAASR